MKNSLRLALLCFFLSAALAGSAQVEVSFLSSNPTCNDYTNGQISAIIDGGSEPLTFLWSTGDTISTLQNLPAGIYSLTVTDGNGITGSNSVELFEPAPPVATITGTNIGCNGNSGSLTVTVSGAPAPYGYSWSTQESTATIQVTAPGNYFVTVLDANGCADVADYTVANPLNATVMVTNIPCATDPLGGALNVMITGGLAPYTVLWNDNNTSVTRQQMPAGTYAVTATDGNGCTATGAGTITMPTPLVVETVAITPSCGGANNGSATVVASGGTPPYTHTWSPGGQTGATATGLAPGQYYVCTFDANQCQKDIWVIIPEITGLDVTLSVNSARCPGVEDGVVTAFVNPPGNYIYQWNLPPFQGVTQLTGLAANTVVSVTVTDPASGCTGTATTTISAHNTLQVTVTDTDIPCAGQNIGLASANASGGTPDYTYVWLLPPANTQIGVGPNISGLAAGAYMVSVTDAEGCTATGVADIGIVSGPDAVIGGSTAVVCGDSISVLQFENLSTDAFGSIASWVWTVTTANGVQTFTNQSPIQVSLPVGLTGVVHLAVTSATGCIDTVSQEFTVPGIPDISLSTGPMAMVCGNGPIYIEVEGGQPWFAYQWSPLNGLTLDSIPPNATANPTVTTTYQLVANDQGCTDTVSVTIVRKPGVEISVDSNLIETCDSTAVLFAHANVPNVVWIDTLGNVIGNNPVTVVAGAPTVYIGIATDSLGCTDSVFVTVIGYPQITLTTDAMMMDCDNDPVTITVNGGSPNYTYVWSPTTGLTPIEPAPNVVADPDTTTTYTLIATSPQGCADTVQVTVIRVIPIELTIAEDSIVTCDSLVVLSAVSNVPNVIWMDTLGNVLGNNPITVVAGSLTTYIAVATDSLGCTDSLFVTVTGFPQVNLTTDSLLVDCDNAPVLIAVSGASPDYTYVWSPTTGLTPVQPAPNVIADPAVTTTYRLIAMGPQGCMDTLGVTVVRVIPIELSIEQDSIVTCDSTVVLMATSNVPNVVWVDANGVVLGNNPITVVAGALTYYTAIATDTSGCVDSLVVSVTGHGVDVSVDPNAMFMGCEQEPIQLGLINNHPDDVLTYLWEVTAPLTISNNTASNPTVSGPAGSYNVTVTVTNQYGCTQTLIIPVLVKPSQVLDGDITMNLCEGLKVSFFNGSNINGVWNFGDNTSSIEANPMHVYAAAGTYLVTFTPINATCVAPWDSLIQVQADTLDRPVIAHNYVVCIDSAQIQFNGTSNNPNVTWVWTFSTGAPATSNVQNPLVTFTAEGPLTATLKVTDVNGCMEDTSVQIQVQFVQDSIVEALTVCPDEFVSLNANGVDSTASYVWTAVPPDPTLVATDKNPSVSPDVVTVYTVNISEASGCSVTYQVTVTPLQGATVTLQNDTTVCNALPLSITATGSGVVYDWSNSITFDTIFASGNIVSITPVRNGIYFVRATSVDGCTAIDSIKINNAGVAAAAGPFDGNICAGEETGLLVNNLIPGDTLTYVWTPTLPGISNPVVSPSEQTNYQVIVTNQFGCKDTLGFQVNVTTIAVDATINGPDVLHPGESTNLLATPSGNGVVISYTWTPATGLSDPNIPNPVASPESDQVYVVTVMTADSCTASDEVLVRFVPNQCDDETVFVPNTFTPNNDSNNDYFIVRAVNITELLFIVWNRWGEKVYQTTDLNAQGWDGSFKGKEATPDAYGWFVRIRCGDGTIYEKKGDVTLLK